MSRWLGFSIREDLAGSPEAVATPVAGRALVLPRRGSPEERELRERAAARVLARMAGVSEELLRTKPPLDWRHTQVVLQDLRELPSLKNLARRFAGRLSGEDCRLDELATEVGRDPALALNVLRLANSVAVGSRERVADLPTALHLLGVERVRRLALLLAAMGDARGVAPGFDWGQLWLHSAACAALAEQLAGWSGVGTGAEARLAGLLHDVGKIALSAVAPDAYRAVLVAAWSRREALPPLEEARLGVDHREAGWILGLEAELPPVVLGAISHHDAPDLAVPEHRAVVAMVAVANRLAKEHGLGFSGEGWVEETTLAGCRAWEVWEAAAGRRLDAEDLQEQLLTRWLEPIKTELAVLAAASPA